MKLSSKAIELCKKKCGKSKLYGIEEKNDILMEEEINRLFQELTLNEMIAMKDGKMAVSAYGQHLIHMMADPEQFIIIENLTKNICVRLYIQNAYYLCVMDQNKEDSYTLELLPFFDLVVGSFLFALAGNDGNSSNENEITVEAFSWDRDGKLSQTLSMKKQDEKDCEFINEITQWMFSQLKNNLENEVRFDGKY